MVLLEVSNNGSVSVASGAKVNVTNLLSVSGGTLTVQSGAAVSAKGDMTVDSGTITIEAGAEMEVAPNLGLYGSTLNLSGTLKGTSTRAECDSLTILIQPGGCFDVLFSTQSTADSFKNVITKNNSGIDVRTETVDGKYRVYAENSVPPAGSVLSEGNPTILIGIMCSAVFLPVCCGYVLSLRQLDQLK